MKRKVICVAENEILFYKTKPAKVQLISHSVLVVCSICTQNNKCSFYYHFRVVALAMSRWREQKLRADNTSVIVVFFEEGGTHPCHPKPLPTGEQATAEPQTDTDTASEVSVETPRALSPSGAAEPQDSERPALVRTMEFRYTEPEKNPQTPFIPLEEFPPCIAQEVTVSCTQ